MQETITNPRSDVESMLSPSLHEALNVPPGLGERKRSLRHCRFWTEMSAYKFDCAGRTCRRQSGESAPHRTPRRWRVEHRGMSAKRAHNRIETQHV